MSKIDNSQQSGSQKSSQVVLGFSRTPQNHTLVSRPADFSFDSSIPKFWQGEVFATRMFDAMQLSFPDGERMFIQSVRNYMDKITDPVLIDQVKHFIYQEGQHGKAHADFTSYLEEQGLKISGTVRVLKNILAWFQNNTPHKFQLAATVAAEHLTASLGEYMMSREDNLLSNAHPTMRAFYMWHGIEEVEHKAVAWDVYQHAAGGGYFTRALAMAILYPLALFPLIIGTMVMMHVDGELNFKEIRKGASAMFGRKGLFSSTFIPVLRYYIPGFHPWQTGYPDNFHQWKKVYSETASLDEAMKSVPY